MKEFDFVIIGSGQAGNPFARAASEKGFSVVMVEKDRLGGTCVNYGCTPTKTMVASAKVAFQSRRSIEFGIKTGEVSIDMRAVKARMDEVREKWRAGSVNSLETADNITIYRGFGRLRGNKQVEIIRDNDEKLIISGQKIIINTGTRARIPEIKGIDQIDYLTNKSILELEEVPEHLIIIGGGYIGVEFAQIFTRLGAKVSIIQRGDQLLSREDRDIAKAVQEILEDEGITCYLSSIPDKVEQTKDGIEVDMDSGGNGKNRISGSHLLLAAGRTPNSDGLGLENMGIETDKRGYIKIDDRFQTTTEHIYAVGDVKGGPAFTHISYDDYRILKKILLEQNDEITLTDRLIPYTIFIDPQLGRVGMSEKQAIEQGIDFKVAEYDAKNVARAFESNETKGVWKVIVHAETHEILGCAILSMEGGEVMSSIQMAMMGGLTYDTLQNTAFSHPTLVESLNNLFTYGFS